MDERYLSPPLQGLTRPTHSEAPQLKDRGYVIVERLSAYNLSSLTVLSCGSICCAYSMN